MRLGTFSAARGRCLALGLLALAAGCGKPGSVEHAEVSGTVLFRGEPLPGGRIVFKSAQGEFANSAKIEQNGTYKINAPVGDVQIGVDNKMLRFGVHDPAQSDEMVKKSGGAKTEFEGEYVAIPTKYYDPFASGLTYKVEKGPQKHNVELSE